MTALSDDADNLLTFQIDLFSCPAGRDYDCDGAAHPIFIIVRLLCGIKSLNISALSLSSASFPPSQFGRTMGFPSIAAVQSVVVAAAATQMPSSLAIPTARPSL